MHLFEDARNGAHDRRPDDGEVLDNLVDPAVDDGRKADLQRQRQHDLAEGMRERKPQIVEILIGQHAKGVHGGGGVGP